MCTNMKKKNLIPFNVLDFLVDYALLPEQTKWNEPKHIDGSHFSLPGIHMDDMHLNDGVKHFLIKYKYMTWNG